ncbi:alkyl hydroperoxide reductase [Actinomycetospora sp. NBRC 106375]|uniref:TlpA family protein disulfide reductase n=1 Tax=Actinomycetospora sp. NBRC 106375 TaxID=3032207 RepID=UPI0024A17E18|nr:TlpA disulfide reductase family protein [Actinomycetospora sp. NBRC 106375]GLZ44782.1 alkyl hydroperoxide reductase [Actinomycetospora sp. NBRC 106375]
MRAALLALAALLLVAGCSSGSPDGNFTFGGTGGGTTVTYDPPESRGVLPAVSGDSLLEPGRVLSTDAYRGQVVVLNVWGSWCGPCRAEADALDQVASASAPRGVQFLGIDVRDQRDAAADFVRDRGVVYPSVFDPPGRSLLVLRGYPRNAVPSTIVLDRSHRVAAVFLTAVLASDLQPVVDRLAAEPAPAS